jgi:hypothetical protein
VRSARDSFAVAACICLLGVGAAGCSTTQEKAAAQQARSERILKARAERQAAKQKAKTAHHKHQRKQKGKK